MKIVIVTLLGVGLFFIGFASIQLHSSQQLEKKALAQAKEELAYPKLKENSHVPAKIFESGQTIGILEIPRIGKEVPIVEGTNEKELRTGVGHFTGTVYPGQNDQILLSGHRDTVFKGLDKLELGDIITVKMQHGTFRYAIVDTEIVDQDDTTVIRSTSPDELLTLSTCYPFRYVGTASKRYIVYAVPK